MLLFGFTLASAQPPTPEGPVKAAFESRVLFTLLLFSFSLLLEFALVSEGGRQGGLGWRYIVALFLPAGWAIVVRAVCPSRRGAGKINMQVRIDVMLLLLLWWPVLHMQRPVSVNADADDASMHAIPLAACCMDRPPGLDEPVRGSVQGSPNDDDGGDGQDQERDRRGACNIMDKNSNRRKWLLPLNLLGYYKCTSRSLAACPFSAGPAVEPCARHRINRHRALFRMRVLFRVWTVGYLLMQKMRSRMI